MGLQKRRSFIRRFLMGTGVAAAFLLESCWKPFKIRLNWSNALLIGGVDPQKILTPSSLQELVDTTVGAELDNSSLKMVGAGHSFSDVAFCRKTLLLPENLNKELVLNRSILNETSKDNEQLVEVEAGMSIETLNKILDENDLALENMGGYDAQTISGAIMTSTHGSGLLFGPINDQIRSMTVVASKGRVLVVEPTNGITDPDKFDGFIKIGDQVPVSATLIQNDNYFNGIVVSMGSCGVIYSVVLETVPKFWLNEVRTVTTWGELIAPGGFLRRLVDGERIGEQADQPKYYEIYFNPYCRTSTDLKDHTCLLTERYVIDNPGELSRKERKRGRQGNKALASLTRLTKEGESLVRFFNKHPNYIPKFIEKSLKELRDDSYKNISHKVFHIGAPNDMRAYGIEMCFKLEHIIAAVESCFVHAKACQKRGWMHSAPPSLRFVNQSNAFMSMTNNQVSAFMEMGILVGSNGSDEFLKSYERLFIEKFGARPHWGLDLDILSNVDQVRALYGSSCDEWLAVYQDMNSTGVFNGQFTDRLGISVLKDS